MLGREEEDVLGLEEVPGSSFTAALELEELELLELLLELLELLLELEELLDAGLLEEELLEEAAASFEGSSVSSFPEDELEELLELLELLEEELDELEELPELTPLSKETCRVLLVTWLSL